VVLLPAVPDLVSIETASEERRAFLASRARLATHDRFTLCGIAGLGPDGRRNPVHVHSKLMLVDDEWATVGSCNLHHHSLFGNGELNAAIHDAETVRALRIELFSEHLAIDTSEMSDSVAHQAFRRVASENRQRHESHDPKWQGMAIRLNMETYALEPQR